MITAAIIGLGGRGRTYLANILGHKDMSVAALCDIDAGRLKACRLKAGLDTGKCYNSDTEFFAAGKLADCLVVATQDRNHYTHAMQGLKLGYHILLEKPVSPIESECEEIAKEAEARGLNVLVCHVLRYSGYYRTIKRILESGVIGEIVNIEMTENEGYWHHANSYTRGPWAVEADSASFLLAKCCHDIDILYWMTGSRAVSVSSMGGLKYFKPEYAPADSGDRCADCIAKGKCSYNAERLFAFGIRLNNPNIFFDFIIKAGNTFSKKLRAKSKKLLDGPQGRCVYKTGKDVCDHQITLIRYENSVVATQTVTAFSMRNYRGIRVYGTKGELYGSDNESMLTLNIFGKKPQKIKLKGGGGHQGGDAGVIDDFVRVINGDIDKNNKDITFIKETLESHRVIFAAERSRKDGGRLVEL